MGIGFTIDTPLKVSHLGMDSVISLLDDILLEKLRKMYSSKYRVPYAEITDKIDDFRAKRITAYLNLISELVEEKFDDLKNVTLEKNNDLKNYFNMLPDSSSKKQEFKKLTADRFNISEVKKWLDDNLSLGNIDVNIMTKVDKDNYIKNEKLPTIYNDAHAALRGYASSNLSSSMVFSAGMNPRLYSYLEQFDDFYPNENGVIKKKIILKVSDYRSALIQGKFLAKKGLWVSEYRIESGLNCGGHAFATDGHLIGPILGEFKNNKQELITTVNALLINALTAKNRKVPKTFLDLKISAQGGVGDSEEHEFLLNHYEVDSVGWGSPFLLVPESTTVDDETLSKLMKAEEKDLYLSHISPLGVPFNNLRGNTKDDEKTQLIDKGRPGSSCPKKFVALNNEFTEKAICTASRQYQNLKLKELDSQELESDMYNSKYNKIVEKSCICVGLGTSALLTHNISTKTEGDGVAVCPGPNLAYFSKIMSLKDITDHIYGRSNMISRTDRPNMFIKELNIYIDYLKTQIEETKIVVTKKQERYLKTFAKNLQEGINYYHDLFINLNDQFKDTKSTILNDLNFSRARMQVLEVEINSLSQIETFKKII
ncbi:hypothetical protein A9Q87_05285 [Flavobacteriales bacterium 34_180_T64]|nr:hypothetical protein A9Q87_05285 [Flavobacteriales bacterium 34_180_T64]